VRILAQEIYRGFVSTLASEYLTSKHQVKIGREALRQVMMEACLWRSRKQKVEAIHPWRPRRSSRGELVPWDTSEHRLAGRARGETVSDPHDRRCHQRVGRTVYDARLEGGKPAVTGDVCGAKRAAVSPSTRTKRACSERRRRSHATKRSRRGTSGSRCRLRRSDGRCANWRLPGKRHTRRGPKGEWSTASGRRRTRLVKGLRVAGARTLEEANQPAAGFLPLDT
jgi:hypothetical protein